MTDQRAASLKYSEINFSLHLYYILLSHLHKIFLVKQFAIACDLIANIYIAEVNLDLKLRHH